MGKEDILSKKHPLEKALLHTCTRKNGAPAKRAYLHYFRLKKIGPFINCLNFQVRNHDMKMIFILMQIKLIFPAKVLHLASFWKREFMTSDYTRSSVRYVVFSKPPGQQFKSDK